MKELEWEFLRDGHRQWCDISNCSKTIKKKSGGYAFMRLKNEIKLNLKYEMNVCVGDLQNDAVMLIGLVNSKDWYECINYHNSNGKIRDNNQEIKTVNTKLSKDSIMTIKNKVIRKTNNNEYIFKVSFTINDDILCQLLYQDVQPKVPYLVFGDVVEVEVDVEVISKISIIFLRS